MDKAHKLCEQQKIFIYFYFLINNTFIIITLSTKNNLYRLKCTKVVQITTKASKTKTHTKAKDK
jgi:hypothetical protein